MNSYKSFCTALCLFFSIAYTANAEINEAAAAKEEKVVATNTEAALVAEQAAARRRADMSNRFADEVKKREAQYGIYDPKTGEYLLSIGLLHKKDGHHQQAMEAFERALQIQRVNEGLESTSQFIILEQLIETGIAAEKWDAVDKNYQKLLWVNRRNYAAGDPRLLPITDKVGRWKLHAYRNKLLSQSAVSTLQEAAALFSSTVAILGKEYGANDPILVNALYGEALSNYQVAFEVLSAPLDEFQGRGSPDIVQTVCTPIKLPNGRATQSCRSIRLPNPHFYAGRQQNKNFSVAAQLGKVKASLERIIAIHQAHPDLPAEEHAMALVHLGDWHLLQNRRSTALGVYTDAYNLLAQKPESENRLQRLFGKPVSLPALRLPLPELQRRLQKSAAEDEYALATFDVSQSGKPKNIHIIETNPPQSKSHSRKAKKTIKARRYRPKFEAGQPVDSIGNRIRVLL